MFDTLCKVFTPSYKPRPILDEAMRSTIKEAKANGTELPAFDGQSGVTLLTRMAVFVGVACVASATIGFTGAYLIGLATSE